MAEERLFDDEFLRKQLKKALSEPINFAIGLGSSPGACVLVMHPLKEPRKLFEAIKSEKKLVKGTWGTATTDPKILTLNIERKAPGLCKNLKLFLKNSDFKQKRPLVLFEGRDITDEEEIETPGETALTGSPAENGAALKSPTVSKETFTKAAGAWGKTREIVAKELQKLKTSILTEFKDSDDVQQLTKSLGHLDEILNHLDDRLADRLNAAANAPDAAHSAAKQVEANKILNEYQTYVKGDPLICSIDSNPFAPLSVQKTLIVTLQALSAKLAV